MIIYRAIKRLTWEQSLNLSCVHSRTRRRAIFWFARHGWWHNIFTKKNYPHDEYLFFSGLLWTPSWTSNTIDYSYGDKFYWWLFDDESFAVVTCCAESPWFNISCCWSRPSSPRRFIYLLKICSCLWPILSKTALYRRPFSMRRDVTVPLKRWLTILSLVPIPVILRSIHTSCTIIRILRSPKGWTLKTLLRNEAR